MNGNILKEIEEWQSEIKINESIGCLSDMSHDDETISVKPKSNKLFGSQYSRKINKAGDISI